MASLLWILLPHSPKGGGKGDEDEKDVGGEPGANPRGRPSQEVGEDLKRSPWIGSRSGDPIRTGPGL